MKPLIGITGSSYQEGKRRYNRINYHYINAVHKAGGIPVMLPILDFTEDVSDFVDRLDGLLLSGGADISPLLYDEDPLKEVTNIDYKRDRMEVLLYERAFTLKMPILGICRGMQLVNIMQGGSLYQDVHVQLKNVHSHNNSVDVTEGYHTIVLTEGFTLFDLFKKTQLAVNSEHHQAIKDLGDDLVITALSKDSIIEGIEWEGPDDRFLKCVQFHPEAMVNKKPDFLKIFTDFIEASRLYHAKK